MVRFKISSYLILSFINSIALGFLDTSNQSIFWFLARRLYSSSLNLFSSLTRFFNNRIANGFVFLDTISHLICFLFFSFCKNSNAHLLGLADKAAPLISLGVCFNISVNKSTASSALLADKPSPVTLSLYIFNIAIAPEFLVIWFLVIFHGCFLIRSSNKAIASGASFADRFSHIICWKFLSELKNLITLGFVFLDKAPHTNFSLYFPFNNISAALGFLHNSSQFMRVFMSLSNAFFINSIATGFVLLDNQ